MPFDSEKYLEVFDKNLEDSPEEKIQDIKSKDIFLYRTKTIKSGNMLECETYPVGRRRKEPKRATRENESRRAQKNLNDKNSKKRIIRLINSNFTEYDLSIGLSYKGKPPPPEQVKKDIRNYLNRVKTYRKKLKMSALKYIYVIEFAQEGKQKRIHLHVVMSGMDRDAAEKIWGKGYANSKRLQPDEFGLEGLARYITKDPRGEKRWSSSKNLAKPKVSIADHKITKRKAQKLAMNENGAPEYFEKLYKGYTFMDLQIKYSDFVPGAYLYARMRMKEDRRTHGKTRTSKTPGAD